MKKTVILMAGLLAVALAGSAQAGTTMFAVQNSAGTDQFVVQDTGLTGIGTSTPSGGSLHVVATSTPILNDILGMNQAAGMGVDVSTPATAAPAGAIQAANYAFLIKYQNGGSAINNNFNTFRMVARTDSTVTDPIAGAVAAGNFQVQHKGTNTASNIIALVANTQLLGTGNVTGAAAIRAAAPAISGTGIMSNAYGVSIKPQKQTGVTNGWGVYQEGVNDVNYFQGKVQLPNLAVYANNAAAVAGGLSAGMLYRTGGDPDVIAVVH